MRLCVQVWKFILNAESLEHQDHEVDYQSHSVCPCGQWTKVHQDLVIKKNSVWFGSYPTRSSFGCWFTWHRRVWFAASYNAGSGTRGCYWVEELLLFPNLIKDRDFSLQFSNLLTQTDTAISLFALTLVRMYPVQDLCNLALNCSVPPTNQQLCFRQLLRGKRKKKKYAD